MSIWLPALVSLAGAVLAFFGARLGVRAESAAIVQREGQGRREEWGRRFISALTLVADTNERRRVVGRALLEELLDSELASDQDRQLVARILAVAVMGLVPPEQRGSRGRGSLDDIEPTGDNGERVPGEGE